MLLTLPFAKLTQAAKPPRKMRPQPGDLLVFRFGAQKGQPVAPDDIPLGTDMVQAVAMDPATGILRDGSRLNGLLLVRLDRAQLSDATQPHAAGGIVAYSSVCNHQGCDLTQWLTASRTFQCYCHYSQFDATDQGKPVHGPARRRLAILPLKRDDGKLIVAERFVGKVGFKRPKGF